MRQYVDINDNLFQIIKLKYVALGLIADKELNATNGGTVECIILTNKRKEYFINKAAIKKK